MAENFGELVREVGLKDVNLTEILRLPKSEDINVETYLCALVGYADCQAEIERLWLEAVELLIDEEKGTVIDPESFVRVLRIMPMIPEKLVDEGLVSKRALIGLLKFIYDCEESEGWRLGDSERSFEAILMMMPPKVIYGFFSMAPQLVTRVLLNLTMGAERFIFLLDENVLRKILMKKENEALLNVMMELFRVMGVEFNLFGKDLDPAWAENKLMLGTI